MKRYASLFLGSCVSLLLAAPAFAQTAPGGGGEGDATKWVIITAGFAMAIAAAACGYAQSRVGVAACEGMARNPGARPGLFLFMILSLVFIETLALFTFAMILTKVKVG